MTVAETLSVQRPHTGVAVLSLNRPERLKAINETVAAELGTALADLGADRAANVVVLTGAGRSGGRIGCPPLINRESCSSAKASIDGTSGRHGYESSV